jgi:hypothetical protein
MIRNPRIRFWVETGLAAITAVMCLVALVWPAWIEAVFGVDPDRGSGELEWAIVAGLAVASVTLGVLARVEWVRRATAGR